MIPGAKQPGIIKLVLPTPDAGVGILLVAHSNLVPARGYLFPRQGATTLLQYSSPQQQLAAFRNRLSTYPPAGSNHTDHLAQ